MENIIQRLLEYTNIEVVGGETANIIRDIENKDYIVSIPNKFNNVNIDIKVVEKIRYNEVSIYSIDINTTEISFRISDSNILMGSYIWIKEKTNSTQPMIRTNNEDNSKLIQEIKELREENNVLTKKYSEMEERVKSIEKNITEIKNRNNHNNQKRNETNNIPRVDIKSK